MCSPIIEITVSRKVSNKLIYWIYNNLEILSVIPSAARTNRTRLVFFLNLSEEKNELGIGTLINVADGC